MTNIELNSVGTVVDENGITHPINADGTYDLDEGVAVHLLDVDSEWFNSMSSTDLEAFFSFLENTQHLLAGVYNTWRDNIQSEWYQVNVIDCTEGSNWTDSYGVEEDGYLLSQSEYSEVD